MTVSVEKNKAKYRVTTTCFLTVNSKTQETGKLEIAGSLTKTKEDTKSLEVSKNHQEYHIINIGKLIEANESEMRSEMESIYINKAR